MANITFNGLGSGLKVADIVGAIVGAEKVPYETRLNQKEGSITTDISAVGALKSALQKVQDSISNLADADRYQLREVKGNDDFISMSSNKDAEIGNYSVKVDRLAEKHKLVSTGIDSEEAIGKGTLTIKSGENSFDITASDTSTLADIRDAINDSNDNESVIATIITDDGGQHLVLSSKETGLANAITIVVDDVSDGNNQDALGLSRLAYDPDPLSATHSLSMNEATPAVDAQITIDGTLVVTNSTNTFTNVIDGVDITAKKIHAVDDDLSSVTLSENNANVEAGLNQFVKNYNALVTLSKSLGQAGEGGTGPLAGDSLLRGVMSKLRQQISTPFETSNGNTLSLSQLGVRSDRYGVLSLDKDDLNEAIANDVDGVQNFFVGSDEDPGFASSVDTLMKFYTDSGGLIDSRIEGKKSQLEGIDDDRISFGRKMDSLEARLYKQYNAMDLLVANLNATGSYITAQLDNMPGVVKQNK
ncbi:flagellar hook protein FliD [Colwellia demingiae]|uniref:Flagellar hook-associated protein 2 n=1 Tax=Colwellia demingiae TaxID=89401 RepID=A0A5C6QM31_9GAMM|nr:flagellar filament capping protein FliD [Colwellia demingiae]TWX69542.1 flagellar hook protein FliD [Colwellia demingiae]